MEKAMKSINSLLVEKLKNRGFEKKYHRTTTLFQLADEFLLLRRKRGLTQKELAEKAETIQAVVSRLENASVKPSLETILKIAEALDAAVEVKLIPLEDIREHMDELGEDNAQKQQDAQKGIVYFHMDQGKKENSKWIGAEEFSKILSISGKPSYAPITSKRKVRQLA